MEKTMEGLTSKKRSRGLTRLALNSLEEFDMERLNDNTEANVSEDGLNHLRVVLKHAPSKQFVELRSFSEDRVKSAPGQCWIPTHATEQDLLDAMLGRASNRTRVMEFSLVITHGSQ
jgi:hypothetical protein